MSSTPMQKQPKTKNCILMGVLDEEDQQQAMRYAKHWLASIGLDDAVVTPQNCYFYHSLEAPVALKAQIDRQG